MDKPAVHSSHAHYSVTKHADESYSFDGVTDFDFNIDSLKDSLTQLLKDGEPIDTIVEYLTASNERDVMSKVLIKLLVLLSNSSDLKGDIELLISCAGLNLREESDAKVAARLGITRQVFSARKKVMLKRLKLTPPAHSKSQSACEEYQKTNTTKYNYE